MQDIEDMPIGKKKYRASESPPNVTYERALKTYLSCDPNPRLAALLMRGKTSYSEAKLKAELKKLKAAGVDLEIPEMAIANTQQPIEQPKKAIAKPETALFVPNHEDLPPELQELNIHKAKLYRQAGKLHSQLIDLSSDEQRLDHARTIISNFEHIDDIWGKIDHWVEHGELLPEPEQQTLSNDPLKLVQRRNNLRAYISKAEKEIKIAKDPVRKSRKEEKLQNWKLELADIEKKLRNG